MFGKKKSKKPAMSAFLALDEQKTPLAQYDAAALPLNREAVLEKSVEFFQDPNPCAIHEGAVRMRMLAELEAFLMGKGPVPVAELPASMRRYLNLEAACVYIALSES